MQAGQAEKGAGSGAVDVETLLHIKEDVHLIHWDFLRAEFRVQHPSG